MKFSQFALSGGPITLFNSVMLHPDRVAEQENFVYELL